MGSRRHPLAGQPAPPSSAAPCRGGTSVTDLAPRPLRRLVLATEAGPGLELTRPFPDTPAALLDD
ncbi:hypothetical protein AB0N20_08715 [Streptomyces griseoincarnatus]